MFINTQQIKMINRKLSKFNQYKTMMKIKRLIAVKHFNENNNNVNYKELKYLSYNNLIYFKCHCYSLLYKCYFFFIQHIITWLTDVS